MQLIEPSSPIPPEPAVRIPEDPYLAFAHDPYYPRVWKALIEGRGRFAGFNPWVLVYGTSWLFFRKMHRLGLCLLPLEALFFLLPAIVSHLSTGRAHDAQTLAAVGGLSALLFVHLPLAFFANRLYFKKADTAIRAIQGTRIPKEYVLPGLKAQGGVSVGALLLSFGAKMGLGVVLGAQIPA